MGRARHIACVVLLLCPLALSRHDDDFAFDNSDELQAELAANQSEVAKNGLRRLWGVPDTSAYVGHLFRMEIPKEAFSGNVVAYKVRSEDGRSPGWLAVDTRHGLVSGVPTRADVGSHAYTVTALGDEPGLSAADSFTIEVKKAQSKPQSAYGSCGVGEARLTAAILVQGAFAHIAPRAKTRALMDLAQFMALHGEEFWMEPYKHDKSHTVLIANGASPAPHDPVTAIYFNVGCNTKLWSRHKVLVSGLSEQLRDGTLAHVTRLPVVGWRLVAITPLHRAKRQSPELGSGDALYDAEYDGEYDDDDADHSGYDDSDDGGDNDNDEMGNSPDMHPHRHHHGEGSAPTAPAPFQPSVPAPTAPPPAPGADTPDDITSTAADTTTDSYTTEEHKVKITPYSASASEATIYSTNFTLDPALVKPRHFDETLFKESVESSTTIEPDTQTVVIRASNELPVMTSSEPPTVTSPPPSQSEIPTTEMETEATSSTTTSTTASTTSTTSTTTSTTSTTLPPTTLPTTTPLPETTLPEVTTQDVTSGTEGKSTIIGQTTETVTFAMPPNQPPSLKHHMKKLAIIAGKAFRYIIPADLFTDAEDSNLTFTMYEADNVPLRNTSWIQFIPSAREVYGLPLEAHVSRWNFIVEAQDSGGQAARGPLDITVQQYRGGRTINHQFTMRCTLMQEYKNSVDWQIRALEGIVNLFRYTDMDQLTVLNATCVRADCELVWTNDTLPKDPACPADDINTLMKIMESPEEAGAPSAALVRAMAPQLKVQSVRGSGAGRCAATPAATRAPDTYPPVTRNQVDHLTAMQGHLFVYKVPEDTFFDPEDGGTRQLSLHVVRGDRSPLAADGWLQFDRNNQEFYGLPGPGDLGASNYQLIAEDSSKKSAYDSLIVEVVKSPAIRPAVEFHMTLDCPRALLASAAARRRLVEKLAQLFAQTDTQHVRVHSITDNPTTIVWYNTSLPMDRCPKKEIEELRKMIIADERGTSGGALRENVDQVFDKDLKVMSIRLIPLGLCAEQGTKVPKTSIQVYPGGANSANSKVGSADNSYLLTFVIPAVVIVCMIVLAALVACALYRKRRMGKMSVGDEEERQAFRSKGIPVIFQDELEERADTEPVHKSPVIMREEKPPLLPPAPDYRPGDDAPYRPPPPFAPTRTPPRPKATPTYRKPPPYVPP